MYEQIDRRQFPTLFASADSTRYGVTEWALRTDSKLEQMTRGVRQDLRNMQLRSVPSWADRQWELESQRLRGLMVKYPQLVASHFSAARLYGLPLPFTVSDRRLHVATDDLNLRIRRPGAVLHRLTDFESTNFYGHRLLRGPQLFIQLASVMQRDQLVQVGDAMIGRWHGPPLCTLAELAEAVTSRKYVRNRARLNAALDLIRPNVDSPKETELRLWAVSVGLPEPEVHPAVFCRALNCELHPDLGYSKARLGLEYEGDQHRTDRIQWNADISRMNALAQEGWTIIRVSAGSDMATVERTIRACLAASGFAL